MEGWDYLDVVILVVVIFVLSVLLIHKTKMIERYEYRLDSANESIKSLEDVIDRMNEKNSNISERLNVVNRSRNNLKSRNEELRYQINRLEDGDKLHVPTVRELENYLSISDVDENEYVMGNYTCFEFSADLQMYLKKEGVFSCVTYIYYRDYDIGHALLAVNTTDGVKYVEPQSDVLMDDLEVGDDYFEKVGWRGSKIIDRMGSCFGD